MKDGVTRLGLLAAAIGVSGVAYAQNVPAESWSAAKPPKRFRITPPSTWLRRSALPRRASV
jgi:hypothetical protein